MTIADTIFDLYKKGEITAEHALTKLVGDYNALSLLYQQVAPPKPRYGDCDGCESPNVEVFWDAQMRANFCGPCEEGNK